MEVKWRSFKRVNLLLTETVVGGFHLKLGEKLLHLVVNCVDLVKQIYKKDLVMCELKQVKSKVLIFF